MSEYEVLSVCLSCAGDEDTFNIFVTHECDGLEEVYADMLKSCFNIEIPQDSILDAMCGPCIFKLREAFYFKKALEKNYEDLTNQMRLGQNKEKLIKQHNITLELDLSDTSKQYLKYEAEVDPTTGQMNLNLVRSELEENFSETNEEFFEQIKEIKSNNKKEETRSSDVKKDKKRKVNVNKKMPYELEPGQTQCSLCDASLPTTKSLHDHMNVHFPNYACDVCGNKYSSEKKLKRHAECHLEGPFPCEQCDLKFEKLNTRNAHVWRVHHQAALPYACADCEKRFKTFYQRLAHQQKDHGHTEPKYPCPYCDKKFFYSGVRSQHIRQTHLGERNYGCSHCKMNFHKRRELLYHQAAKHGIGEKNHKCTLCDKSFYRGTALKYHMKIHEKKKIICELCGKVLASKKFLASHVCVHASRSHKDASPAITELPENIFDNDASNDACGAVVYLAVINE